MAQRIILDTDIGDDIDDAYALALVLAWPELELAAVTTVFGNTLARARQAQTILKLAGRDDIPVAAGMASPISPRVEYRHAVAEAGVAGLEVPWPTKCWLDGDVPCQDGSALPAEELPPLDRRHAVQLLIETLMDSDGQIIVVTIGAQTNLAVALAAEPRLVRKIRRVVSMAGRFNRQQAEWNIRCDPVAAALVAASGLEVTYVPLDVTTRCVLSAQQLQRLLDCDRPVARNLAEATRLWQGGQDRRPTLHDPLAVSTLIRPELVQTRSGIVTVELAGQHTYGQTLLREPGQAQQARHHVCVEVQAEQFLQFWLDRVLNL